MKTRDCTEIGRRFGVGESVFYPEKDVFVVILGPGMRPGEVRVCYYLGGPNWEIVPLCKLLPPGEVLTRG